MRVRIVVTGSSGFVGRALVPSLRAVGHTVAAPGRAEGADLADPGSFRPWLEGCETLVHLAAHNPPRWKPARAAEFDRLNAEASAALGRLVQAEGEGRFVFLSSARVYGIQPDQPYREDAPLAAEDAYGRSKAKAERLLAGVFAAAPERLLILRTPVIYGPGRGGTLGLAARLARHGWKLPRDYMEAEKSVLSVANLIAAIGHVVAAEEGLWGTFNLTDGEAVTLSRLAEIAGGRPARQLRTLPLPGPGVLGALPPIGPAARHLAAPCVLDDRALRSRTGWQQPVSAEAALREAFGG